jgi:hypothetical protein
VARWISGPDPADPAGEGRRIEVEVVFFDVDTRVVHSERLRPTERKLVYREVRPKAGRTLLLEWVPYGSPRVSEVVGQGVRRRELDVRGGAFLPLDLVEIVRTGGSFSGAFPVFSALAADVESLRIETRATREAGSDGEPARRELELLRGDLLAGWYAFEGTSLVSFRWQEGGPVARPITAEGYRALLRLNQGERGH